MYRKNWKLLLASGLACAAFVGHALAQDAIRCDVDGKATYGDKPCPKGVTGSTVAPTQDTAEQKKNAAQANKQICADTAAVDKRMDDRLKRETVRPAKAAKSESVSKKSSKGKQSAKHSAGGSGSGGKKAKSKAKSTKSKSGSVARQPSSPA